MILSVFRPEHLSRLELQPAQQDLKERLHDPDYGHALALTGEAYSVLNEEGGVLACCGVAEFYPHRGEMWALLSGKSLLGITRAARAWIAQTTYKRLECTVAEGFEAGARWAQMLGFSVEGPLRMAYMADGRNAYTYVRIKE